MCKEHETHESYVYVGRYMQGTWKVRNHDKYRQEKTKMQGICKGHVRYMYTKRQSMYDVYLFIYITSCNHIS